MTQTNEKALNRSKTGQIENKLDLSNEKAKALKHVREVCPELMELSLGCEVGVYADNNKPYGQGASYDNFKGIVVGETKSFWHIRYNETEGAFPKDSEYMKSKITEIIGHTPHLEHWLMGIKEVWSAENRDEQRYQNEITEFISEMSHGYEYNLSKDGNNQSPEFYQAYNKITS